MTTCSSFDTFWIDRKALIKMSRALSLEIHETDGKRNNSYKMHMNADESFTFQKWKKIQVSFPKGGVQCFLAMIIQFQLKHIIFLVDASFIHLFYIMCDAKS